MSVDNTGLVQSLTAGRGVISATVGSISNSTSFIAVVSSTAGVARFAYVTGSDGTLSGYSVNVSSSQVRANGYVLTGKGPTQVEVDPLGRFAFVANLVDRTISAYKIDSVSGTLAPVTGSPFAVGRTPGSMSPGSLIVDPSGTFLYVITSTSVSGFSIDSETGALSQLSGSPWESLGDFLNLLSIDPSGKYLYAAAQFSPSLYGFAIDRTSGALTRVPGSPFATGSVPTAVVVEPTGNFAYVAEVNDVSGFQINTSNGTLTPLTGSPYSTGLGLLRGVLTTDPLGKSLYVGAPGGILGFTIASTGVLTAISGSPFPVDSHPLSMRIDPTGTLAFVSNFLDEAVAAEMTDPAQASNEIETFSIDPSGALSPLKRMRTHPGAYSLALQSGPAAVAYGPKFVYTANLSSNNVSAYAIDSKTGALASVAGSPYPAGSGPNGITTDPTGRFAYAANYAGGSLSNVSGFAIDPSSGALTSVPGSPFAAGGGPNGIATDPSSRFLYVSNYNSFTVSAYAIDGSTGALTPLSGSPYPSDREPIAVAIDPTGQFLYTANQGGVSSGVSAYKIDPASGMLTALGFVYPQGGSASSIVIDPSGRFVYVSDVNNNVTFEFAINPNGTWTQVGATTPPSGTQSAMNIEPTGRFLYHPNGSLYSIDQITGILTQVSGVSVSPIVPDPSGSFGYAKASGVAAYSIDPNTGALTPVTGSPFGSLAPWALTVTGAIH